MPFGTGAQVPTVPGRLQAKQPMLQSEAQQTPWAQKPLLHSSGIEHIAPLSFFPHEFAVQVFGGRHCVLFVQALKQREPLQMNGLHGIESGATHWPLALQVDGAL